MALTTVQLQTLKAAIVSDLSLNSQPNTATGNAVIKVALESPSSPAYIVWRSQVSQDEIMQNGFDWVRVDNLSIGKARIWEWLFANGSKSINPSKANVRAGIDEAWKGTAPDLAVRAVVYTHCKRTASRLEQILAIGTGTDAAPSTLGYEGGITTDEIEQARTV